MQQPRRRVTAGEPRRPSQSEKKVKVPLQSFHMGRIVATDVVSVQPTGIVDQCVTVDSPGDAASLLERCGFGL